MADPITIIGTVGALCNIIDVVNKTLTTINIWRTRWKDSDLYLLGLASQLVALRSALTKIREWMDAEAEEVHHQLTMDLDISVSCCKALVDKMGTVFGQFQQPNSEPLDVLAKLKITFGTGGIDELQKLLGRHTSALTLLLTACNCKAICDQKQLLEKPKSRKTLERAKVDTASLIVHRDNTSLISKFTDNLSKISVTFNFDRQIFSSKVYERVFRSTFKDTLRKNDRRQPDNSQDQPVRSHSRLQDAFANPEPPSVKTNPALLIQERLTVESLIVNKRKAPGIREIWLVGGDASGKAIAVSRFQAAFETKPSMKTSINSRTCDLTFLLHGCQYLLIDRASEIGILGLFPLETIPIIVFVVDLCGYNQIIPSNTYTKLAVSLLRFRYLANLNSYQQSPILLMFNCSTSFASKLQISPLQRHFLDFDGGTDVYKATSFITNRFLDPGSIMNSERITPCHCYDKNALDTIKSFFDSIET